MTVTIDDSEVREALRKLEGRLMAVLETAVGAAADVLRDTSDDMAPSYGNETELAEVGKNFVEFHIGPSKKAFYLQFFETGVQPFEVDMVRRVTTRSSGSGRKVDGSAKALAWDGVDHPVAIVRRGAMSASPFLRPAFDADQDDAKHEFGKVIKDAAEDV